MPDPEIKVGDKVRILVPIYEGCEDLPPDLLASPGEILFVRRVKCDKYAWAVSHSLTQKGQFTISRSEFEPVVSISDTSTYQLNSLVKTPSNPSSEPEPL